MLSYRSSEPETVITNESYTSVVMSTNLEQRYSQNILHWVYINSKQKSQSIHSEYAFFSIERERKNLENFILELGELNLDWDGYGGLPLCQAVIDHGLNLIRPIFKG